MKVMKSELPKFPIDIIEKESSSSNGTPSKDMKSPSKVSLHNTFTSQINVMTNFRLLTLLITLITFFTATMIGSWFLPERVSESFIFSISFFISIFDLYFLSEIPFSAPAEGK